MQVRPMFAILLARLQKADAQSLKSAPEMRIVSYGCSWLPFRDQPRYPGFRQDDSRVPFYRLGHYIARLAVYLSEKKNTIWDTNDVEVGVRLRLEEIYARDSGISVETV